MDFETIKAFDAKVLYEKLYGSDVLALCEQLAQVTPAPVQNWFAALHAAFPHSVAVTFMLYT